MAVKLDYNVNKRKSYIKGNLNSFNLYFKSVWPNLHHDDIYVQAFGFNRTVKYRFSKIMNSIQLLKYFTPTKTDKDNQHLKLFIVTVFYSW